MNVVIMPPVLINEGRSIKIESKYINGHCYIERGTYPATRQPYLRLLEKMGATITICTRAVEGYSFGEPDYCFIANYSENEGMLEALVKAGVIEDTGRKLPQGFIDLNIAKIIMT